MTDVMIKNKLISIDQVVEHEGYNPTEIYRSIKASDVSVFEKEEVRMLDRIILKYGHLSGKQLEELSHSEAPYASVDAYKEVPYEFSYYRGTDFSDL